LIKLKIASATFGIEGEIVPIAPLATRLGLHNAHASFASIENSVMSGTEKGFEERAATFLETKSPKYLTMLVINFSIN